MIERFGVWPKHWATIPNGAQFDASGVDFDPATLNPYIWLEADSGVAADEFTNRISAWASKVNGITLANATGAQQPLYIAADAAYNNQPVVHFDAAAALNLFTPLASITGSFSTFEYGQQDGGQFAQELTDTVSTGHGYQWQLSTGSQRFWAFNGAITTVPAVADAAAAKRSLYRGINTGTSVGSVSRNAGALSSSAMSGAPVGVTLNRVRVGMNSTNQIQKLPVYMVFKRELPVADRTNLHNHYAAKYG